MIRLNEEKGFVLMTALLIMIILTLVGMGAIMNSSVEMNISRNERLGKDALFAADAGTETVPAIISYYINVNPASSSELTADLQAVMTDPDFLKEVMDYAGNDGLADTTTSNPDIQMTVQGRQVDIDIDRLNQTGLPLPGASAPTVPPDPEMGASLVCYYRADSLGQTDQGTNKTVEVIYRRLLPQP